MSDRLAPVPRFIPVREGLGWAVHDIGEVFTMGEILHPRHVARFWRKATAVHIAEQLHFAYHLGMVESDAPAKANE